ncbi:proline iminopeptidase-family hydrolase [Sphingomonas bacterium]|uniref:proline iminopeptidase-family hydrolase n=1 Tax=Sphingomonas bacterium TaxID=1895847 RepID=UPI00262DE1F8|nr:proline iminopeptidase-family hydrolase [Sphingomonas bacterium]MDB5678635.1 proline-specific peptidase [Sphingomonas bacterium]
MRITRREAVAALGAMALSPGLAAAPPVTEGHADVPGGRIWWMKVGGGGGTPLLTLHGGPGAGHNYLLPLRALADQRPVIFYDQLGCGRADSPADEKIYTIQRSVDEVDAVRRALGLDRAILFGHSWGSMLAIEYLCQGRGKGIEKLILGGALASIPQAMAGQQRLIAAMPNGGGARMHALEKAGKTDSPEYQKLVQQFYDLHVCRVPPTPDALATFDNLGKSIAYRVMNGPNEFTITGVIKDWDRRADLGRIKVPTYITTGAFDEITLDCHQTIRRGIAGSRLEIFAGCSHLTMIEQPVRYVAALRRFLGA